MNPLRVLFLEDSKADVALVVRALQRGGYEPTYRRVETEADLGRAIASEPWDVMLADFSLPQYNGVSALVFLRRAGLDIPFILVSGTIDEEVAVRAMKGGAHDYVLKSNLRRLVPVIERELREATLRREARRLETVEHEHLAREVQRRQTYKLQSIGQLAAGIAHEINTPVQYITDNVRVVQESMAAILRLVSAYDEVLCSPPEGLAASMERSRVLAAELDLELLRQEIPVALQQAQDGVDRVTRIVAAIKAFSHPSVHVREPVDINRSLQTSILMSKSVWKYVAEMKSDLAEDLPNVSGYAGDLDQVFLNLIINAAHAIEEVRSQKGGLGVICARTRREGDEVEIRIEDSGGGIPEEIRSRIFEPFFTTKPVGKGTGQGLAIAHAVIVEKHGGALRVETELGQGTTFIIRLPIHPPAVEGAGSPEEPEAASPAVTSS